MSAPLVPIVLAWILGLLLGEASPLSGVPWLGASGIALAAGTAWARRFPAQGALLPHPPVYATLLAVALALGGARGALHQPRLDSASLATYNDLGRTALQGTVIRYPERRGRTTRYEMVAHALQQPDGQGWQPARGRLLVTLPPYPAFQYGDTLQLEGDLVTPPVLEGFDYRAFLAHRGIFSLMQNARGTLVAKSQGAPLVEWLFAVRWQAEQSVQRILPEPHASLLGGILLGIESGIPDEVMGAFNATGTTHVLVISGSNFAVLAALFLVAGRRLLGERRGPLLAIGAMLLYMLLVGGDPPVVRAAIMGTFSVFALLVRRQGVALNTLALAALGMTALNPGYLHDVGFQLSMLATLGMILFVPGLSRLTDRVLARCGVEPTRRGLWLAIVGDALLISIAAQLVTTPLIVGTFGRFSLVALLTNWLIVPVQGWLLVSGGLATLAGMLWLPLGRVLAALPFAGLAWTLAVVRWSAALPFASLAIGPFPTWTIWWVYALWGTWLWNRGGGEEAPAPTAPPSAPLAARRWLLWGSALLLALLPWWVRGYLPDGRLHLYALDVGQGDALLIVTPDGKQVLVDGGPDPVPLLTRLGDRLPPWDRTLELLVLTHADADHLGGLPELMARYRAAQVLDSGYASESLLYEAWVEGLGAQGLAPLRATVGQRLDLGQGATLEVIAPGGPPFEALNNNGVVLRLRYGQFCALLTGDIEAEAEARLLSSGLIEPCQVLKVAHHGSRTSSAQSFLDTVRPSVALISAGAENPFGHPAAEVVARLEAMGARVLRTDLQGTVHLTTDGRQLWIETER